MKPDAQWAHRAIRNIIVFCLHARSAPPEWRALDAQFRIMLIAFPKRR